MLEAVGETYWPTYFDVVCQRLRPGGKAVLQVIIIHPRHFQAYRQRPDFIQTHIFPGGMLPTSEIVKDQARRAGLVLQAEEEFAASYVRTLIEWRARFNRAWSRIAGLGFDEGFRRLWNYYLVYCEAGFESGALSVRLYTFERPTITE
jgi:cyclopropane-fatty-acyl-phospholipid synthase